jgi:hypothetical protein
VKHLLTLTFLAFIGCSNQPNSSSGVLEPSAVEIDSLQTTEESSFHCVRSIPEPVLREEANAKFELQSDSLVGFETLVLDNGDVLTIKNWGCEYYILTFQFETVRFQADTNDLEYWFERAGILLTGMLGSLDSPIDIKKGLMHLEYYRHNREKDGSEGFHLGEEIDFGENEIRHFISVDRIANLSDTKYLVEISASIGPL